ncbi:L,D-transpeptidase family protein [Terrabacter sp. NPDC080008]|uniref:L,D-transpeptidase family protein n=1 Tax=Terrabacter sp. NPDC080008 TaxID=3155176 RepID=UPI00344F7CB8
MQAATTPLPTAGGRRRALLLGALLSSSVALVATTSACGPEQASGVAATRVGQTASTAPAPSTPSTTVTTAAPSALPTEAAPEASPTPSPSTPHTPPSTTATPTAVPATSQSPTPTATATPPKPAPVVLLRAGDAGPKVRALQARLRQIGWFSGDVADRYGSLTTTAVSGFQAKRGLEATGTLDEVTWARLVSMTHAPTADELANVKPKPVETKPQNGAWDVDPRCFKGRVMCVSKTTRMLTWVVDGVPQYGFDVRFGSDELPTREGVFPVYKKQVDVISNLYHTPMPYSMFFSGGQAVHYSSNFARLGYAGASHGCINVRDKALLVRLYDEVRIGDKVVVHW